MSTDASQGLLPTGNWTSKSDEDTLSLGARIGERLKGGEILLLDGPLGAGKTILVKGIASALGVDEDEVTSPSFTLVNLYTGRLRLYHLDLYRLNEGAEAAHAVDLEELLTDEQAVVVIEWGARLGRYPLPSPVYHVSIDGDGDAPREIVISLR
ncbi:MAG TPA: tRNA (adenosine(37)-N6)-threonylcarbamoyltransferase complex ATPase subunit type 1 TsaE [Pyrinomonadaceae bacterium]|jgi:tRNA threonylcarbamoyladenosine biosynthesis protein TsaE|nr:tRNA (adenosine(37)-N6)-threonylcarbamoyltransferase complex ATPase subunit type 1 TsaE [Pyrinomonadaceae bacterium]